MARLRKSSDQPKNIGRAKRFETWLRYASRAALDDTPAGPNTRNLDLCPEHGNPRGDCLDCRRETGPELTPEQIRANAAALRTQIAQAGRERVARLAAQRKAQTGDLT